MNIMPDPNSIVGIVTAFLLANMWLIVVIVFVGGVATYYALWGMQRVSSRKTNVTNEELEDIDRKL